MNTYGERVKVTIFGESHGPAIGVVLDGVPAGEAVDMDAVRIQMRRRAPGSSDLTTLIISIAATFISFSFLSRLEYE